MPRCHACETDLDALPYCCNYCGETVCSNHRLPENHNCRGVEVVTDTRKWFSEKYNESPRRSRRSRTAPEPMDLEGVPTYSGSGTSIDWKREVRENSPTPPVRLKEQDPEPETVEEHEPTEYHHQKLVLAFIMLLFFGVLLAIAL